MEELQMAYINVTMNELVTLAEKNAEYDRDRIRKINVINQNQLELTVSIGAFFPDIKVVLVYSRLERGRMYFNVLSSGGVKMIMGLMAEMGKNKDSFMSLEKNNIVIDINKMLSDNLNGVRVKDVSMSGEQIYITVNVS
jgi:hypothetical protein